MKKSISLMFLACCIFFFNNDLRSQWNVNASLSSSPSFHAQGFQVAGEREIRLPLDSWFVAIRFQSHLQFPHTNRFKIELFPDIYKVVDIKRFPVGAGISGALRYDMNTVNIYAGVGLDVNRIVRTQTKNETIPSCDEDGLCHIVIIDFPAPISPLTQYSWAQYYGIELNASGKFQPFAEYGYYQDLKTTPGPTGFYKKDYGLFYLGVRYNLGN